VVILISCGTEICRGFCSSKMESGEVLSRSVGGSMISLEVGSWAISASMSGRLGLMYRFWSLSALSDQHGF
jgi:hypothetical protein